MKTNVTLVSSDRELFGVTIRQQSKTGHLNLSDLQSAYAVAQSHHGWTERNLTEVLNSKSNAERIYYLLSERDLVKLDFSSFMENVESQGVVRMLKELATYKTTGRGSNKTTWCDPYIWVLIAMELNPMLYAKTVIWLTDQLLFNRAAASDNYRTYAESLKRIGVTDFARFGRALNYVVFGDHQTDIRNTATVEQLKELAELEDKVTFLIKMGYVRTQDQALDALRHLWSERQGNPFRNAA